MLEAEGDTPAARRAFLAGLGVEGIAERLVAAALSLQPQLTPRRRLAEAAGLPEGEVVASPMAVQIAIQATRAGVTTRHRELRRDLDWPAAFEPEDGVADPDHGRWIRGKLHTASYRGFLQDEPFASFDPSHVSKWGPHELAHRLVGFFHRRDMSRWELYLGARLNELVPVMLWYGPEQALRGPAETSFDRVEAGKRPEVTVEDAEWLRRGPENLLVRARLGAQRVLEGLHYFEREWAAIDEELSTGRRVRVPHPVLDASSDATAYVVGHHRRLTHPRVATVLERLVPAGCRVETLEEYRDRVERVLDGLLCGSPAEIGEADPAKRTARHRWDLWLRAAHCRAVPDEVIDGLAAGESGDPRVEIRAALPETAAVAVLLDGSPEGVDVDAVALGLESVAPAAASLLDRAWLDAGVREEWFRRRAPLTTRLAGALWRGGPERSWRVPSLLLWEGALAAAARDDGIERLTEDPETLPDALDDVTLVRSEAAQLTMHWHETVPLHARFMAGEDIAEIAPGDATPGVSYWFVVGQPDGQVAVIPAPAGVRRAWDRLADGAVAALDVVALLEPQDGEVEEGWPETGRGWLEELLAARVFGWRRGLSRPAR